MKDAQARAARHVEHVAAARTLHMLRARYKRLVRLSSRLADEWASRMLDGDPLCFTQDGSLVAAGKASGAALAILRQIEKAQTVCERLRMTCCGRASVDSDTGELLGEIHD
jgi:hypothetical protein